MSGTYLTNRGLEVNLPHLQSELQDLVQDLLALERHHASKSWSRNILRHIKPFLDFIERYAIAVDISCQGAANPAPVVWGLLRGVLKAVSSFDEYFEAVMTKIVDVGDMVSIYSQYEKLLGHDDRFRKALSHAYFDIVQFLSKAHQIFTKGGLRLFGKIIVKDFESEFRNTTNTLLRHADLLKAEATLASRKELHFLMRQHQLQSHELHRCMDELSYQDKKDRLKSWLSPLDISSEFEYHMSKQLHPVGERYFGSTPFREWIDDVSDPRLLWIVGQPGAGKSVLCASAIEYVRQTAALGEFVGFHFCSRNNLKASRLVEVLASILWQASQKDLNVLEELCAVQQVAEAAGRSRISGLDSPLHLLHYSLKQFQRAYIVIDGLDECQQTIETLDALVRVVDEAPNAHILLTSRDTPKIRSQLEHKVSMIELTPKTIDADICQYVLASLSKPEYDHIEDTIKLSVRERVGSDARGSFLWASMMIASLEEATSPLEIQQLLETMPRNLNESYAKVITNICGKPPRLRNLALRVLKWTCFAFRPLAWPELQAALAIDLEDEAFDAAKLPFQDVVFNLCSPLVRYHGPDNTYSLTHASVFEFLVDPPTEYVRDQQMRDFLDSIKDAQRILGITCLRNLTFTDLSIPTEPQNKPLAAFLQYSSIYWADHILQTSPDEENVRYVQEFLRSKNVTAWMRLYCFHNPSPFPLQGLLQQRRRLLAWGSFNTQNNDEWDWAIRVPDLLQSLEFTEQDKTGDRASSGTGQTNPPSVSYFQRLMVVRDLVREYTQTGRLAESVAWFERAIKDSESDIGARHPSSVWLINSLGLLYDQQGLVELSSETQELALAIQLKHLGPSHLETVWSRNELGRVYRHLGRLSDAEACHREALRTQLGSIPNAVSGNMNLEVAWTVSTLGRVYRKQQRFSLALDHFHEAFEARREILGRDHPHTLWLLGDIAQSHFENGNHDEAINFHDMALKGRQRALGPQHPDTMWTMNDLAVALVAKYQQHQSDGALLTRARDLQQNALDGQRSVLGDEHSYTKWTHKRLLEVQSCIKAFHIT